MKQVSLRFALLPGYQIRRFYYFTLYSLSPCFLLFADDVFEHAELRLAVSIVQLRIYREF